MTFRYQEAQTVLSALEKAVSQSEKNVSHVAAVVCLMHDRDGLVPGITLETLKVAVGQMHEARRCLDDYARATISALAPETGVKVTKVLP